MDQTKVIPRWLAYFSLAAVCLTWLLIMLGGVVHGTGSSLACPDWPTCYGTFFPPMKGGIFFEHLHRLVASSVGFLTILLCIFFWVKRMAPLRGLALLAVFLVIFQGVLGGLTVIFRLPPAVSIGHLSTSMVFFGLLVWITANAFHPNDKFKSSEGSIPKKTSAAKWIFISLTMVYLQMVLGAMVRHLGAGLACTEIPFCQGSVWPAGPSFLLKIHMLHRLMAIGVALSIFWTTWRVWRSSSPHSILRFLAVNAVILVLLQIGLGVYSVLTALELVPVTAHLGLAALLWANMIMMVFSYQRNIEFKQSEDFLPIGEEMANL